MTGALKLPKDIVGSLRPGDVQLYLTSRGWISEPFGKGGKGLRFHHPSIPQVDLLLPLKRELGDYIIRMAELVTSLATIEERPWSQVVKDLSGPSSDVFRFRVDAADATLGNLPLDEGIDLLRGSRDLLLAASCSALRPQPFHPQRLPKEVRGFLKSCRLGQTERGSFIATIIAPVPPALQRVMDFVDQESRLGMEPFPRRVTTRLMSTLGFVSDAIQAGNLGQILEGIAPGGEREFLRRAASYETLGRPVATGDLRQLGSISRPCSRECAAGCLISPGVVPVHCRGGQATTFQGICSGGGIPRPTAGDRARSKALQSRPSWQDHHRCRSCRPTRQDQG